MDRRNAVKNLSLASIAPLAGVAPPIVTAASERKFLHSVCRWCYRDFTLDEVCNMAIQSGIQSVELLDPADWDTVLQRGLTVALSNGSSLGIPRGFNDPQYHQQLQQEILEIIPMAAEKGIPQIIVFSGNRGNISDEAGLENCAKGLDPVIQLAERYNVRLIMELLNSKVDHRDYQCDRTPWGVKLVDKVGSTHFKLLYDIYHMQIMEGDVIRTITEYKDYIAHYHTAGVPGRHEIDDTQELNYKAIMTAIANNGFEGFVAQEFIPISGNPLQSLKQSIRICSV
jgi:hydroxypyruvate isomerase